MNWDPSFQRKVVYILLLVLLIFPIGLLGLPASRSADGQLKPGGVLSQERLNQGIAQSKLGEIDPASETMRLATFGMQGVATVFLWNAANEYKDRSEWDNLQAVLNQLVKLQPNFLEVWRHQGWNVAYNVSVEFDDYKYRYHWVKKGLDILLEGTDYNRNDPKLLEYIGWVYGHKFGRSDEHVQFRRLFRDDTDYHQVLADRGIPMQDTLGPLGKPDNWLVAYEWYLKAQLAANEKPIKGTSHLLFYSYPGMQRINYADAIEDEGFLTEKSQAAWRKAHQEWEEYGKRPIPSSWGVSLHLGQLDRGSDSEGGGGMKGRIERDKAKLERLAPGVQKKLEAERRAKLSPEEQKALDKNPTERTPTEAGLVSVAESKLLVPVKEIAEQAPEANRAEARVVAETLASMEEIAIYTERYRQIVNFAYWRKRCEIEQTDAALEGRQYLRDAEKQFRQDIDFEKAKATFEKAWDKWAEVYGDDFTSVASQFVFRDADKNRDGVVSKEEAPQTIKDHFARWDTNRDDKIDASEYVAATSDDPLKQEMLTDETSDTLVEAIEMYRDLLDQLKLPFPRDFKLKPLLDAKNIKWHLTGSETPAKPEEKKPADPKPSEPKGEEKKAEPKGTEPKAEEKKAAEKVEEKAAEKKEVGILSDDFSRSET